MTDNTTLISTVKSTHTNVELATVTFPDGTVDSRATARAAYASGAITQGTFVQRMNRLAAYEQTQIDAQKDALRPSYIANS